jgi:ribosome-binding protein aMBF1 (putative translation factor)
MKQARWKSKDIPIKMNCEICGSKKNLQKHHWNYEKPLLVNTLCQTCHEIQHVKNFSQSKFVRQEIVA